MHRICVPITILFTLLMSVSDEGDDRMLDSEARKKRVISSVVDAKINLQSVDRSVFNEYRVYDISLPLTRVEEDAKLEMHAVGSSTEIPRAVEVEHGLIRYLLASPPFGRLNCISFIERILGLESPLIDALQRKGWGCEEDVENRQIALGDVAILYSPKDLSHLRHLAVKFTDDLYLSKMHPESQVLLLTDLESMKAMWQARRVLVAAKHALAYA